MQYKKVLTIAGSDSGGGAGIQADLKTISALGCFGMSAITAVTVQNTVGVKDVFTIPDNIIEGQIDAVISDMEVDAVKIGMLPNASVIRIVSRLLEKYQIKNIVLDPVMISTSGHRLMEKDAIEVMKTQLMPQVRIITPNLNEGAVLSGMQDMDDLKSITKKLSCNGNVSVLLKGGHLDREILTDTFYCAETDEIIEMKSPRIHTVNTHGTGCTLSSAIAAFIAQGYDIKEAVVSAKSYINKAIIAGNKYKIGHGHGPVHYFYNLWKNKPDI